MEKRGATVFLLLVWLGVTSATTKCPDTQLAVYKLHLNTHWNREVFPKQYPEFRPPAQWSRLVGRTHGPDFHMFSLGSLVSPALQIFAEKGQTDGMDAQSQGNKGIYDNFGAEAILQGEGETRAKLFLDGNHTKVSLVVRLVPSPDWFVGVDAVDLCDNEGNWIDKLTIQLDPLDAGTDNGFTFTSPNWPSDPQQPVTVITNKDPDHPASSFFYPDIEKLPHIASLHLHKFRVYKLNKEFIDPQAPRILTSEDLEEMSNRLSGDLNTASVLQLNDTHSTLRPYLTPPEVTTSRIASTTSGLVDSSTKRLVQVKSPEGLNVKTPVQVSVLSSRSRFTLPTRRSLISAGFHPVATHRHRKPEETVVYKSTGSSTYQQIHRVPGVQYYRQNKPINHPSDHQPQSTINIDSKKRQQRIKAIRRRKLAAQRRLRNKHHSNHEFLTTDGKNFES